jgi:hypothetical protein
VSAHASLVLLADFLNPNGGPESTGGFRVDPTVFILIFGFGFFIGVFGHVIKSRTVVGIGIAMIFLSTLLVPLFLSATK